jgi:hypothetical protein
MEEEREGEDGMAGREGEEERRQRKGRLAFLGSLGRGWERVESREGGSGTHVFFSSSHEAFERVWRELVVDLGTKDGRGNVEAGADLALCEAVGVLCDVVDEFKFVGG